MKFKRNSNFIIIHGLKYDKEDIYSSALNLFPKTAVLMNIQVKKPAQKLISLDLMQYSSADAAIAIQFSTIKRCKKARVLITEMLKYKNLLLYKRATKLFVKSAWAYGEKVYV